LRVDELRTREEAMASARASFEKDRTRMDERAASLDMLDSDLKKKEEEQSRALAAETEWITHEKENILREKAYLEKLAEELKSERARMATAAQALKEAGSEAEALRARVAELDAMVADRTETETAFREELAARDDEIDGLNARLAAGRPVEDARKWMEEENAKLAASRLELAKDKALLDTEKTTLTELQARLGADQNKVKEQLDRFDQEKKELSTAQEAFEEERRKVNATKDYCIKTARALKELESVAGKKEEDYQLRMKALLEREQMVDARDREATAKLAAASRLAIAAAPEAQTRKPSGPQFEAIPLRQEPVRKQEPSIPSQDDAAGTLALGTRDIAWAAVSGAQKRLEEMKTVGIHPGPAEDLIKRASVVFSNGDFPLSRDIATNAEGKLRDIVQLHERSMRLLEDIKRTHPTLIAAGALTPEKSDAAERSRRAYESGDYVLAVEQGEKALAGEHLAGPAAGGLAAAGGVAGQSGGPAAQPHQQKHLCPVCNRVFALPPATVETPRAKCPWCGASVQIR